MPVIDDHGRLFGKLNLIDAVVLVVALGLIPLAYGAFLLFRVPVPRITSIQPTQVTQGELATLQLTGEDLRPFLLARFGTLESKGFLVQSPTFAEVKVPELPPGSYDLVLFDQARELVRMPGALTVVAPALTVVAPPPQLRLDVRAVGEFIGLENDDVGLIRVGLKLQRRGHEPAAEVLAVRAPEARVQRVRVGGAFVMAPVPGEVQVPAVVRVSCFVVTNGDCRVGDTVLAQNATIRLPVPIDEGDDERPDQIRFVVGEVLPAAGAARTDVQVVGEFFGLGKDDLRLVQVGSKFERWRDEPFAEVLAVRTSEPGMRRIRMGGSALWTPADGELRVRAIVRMSCVITTSEDCLVDNTVLDRNATMYLPVPRRSTQVKFLIDELRPAGAPAVFPSVRTAVATVRVRFVAGQEVLDVVNVGDVDVSGSVSLADADRAVLMEIGRDQQMVTALANMQGLEGRRFQIEESMFSFTGTVRVPVVFTLSGWSYRDRAVKVGLEFTFESISGAMTGSILDMELSDQKVSAAR